LEKDLDMAWWTDILFVKKYLADRRGNILRGESFLASLNRASRPKFVNSGRSIVSKFSVRKRILKQYLHENLVDLLYIILSIFTYLYLGLTIVAFFFQKYVSPSFSEIIEAFSEPYLGALGIYVIVKEIERRRGKTVRSRWGEMFAVIWFVFFISATILTYLSDEFVFSGIYKTVVTNALAALIIRIGTLLR